MTTAVVGVIGMSSGAAYALTRADGPAVTVRTADEIYSPGLSDEEIASRSHGSPGAVAPPCPSASDVDRLKRAGLVVGPCDPYPEAGEPFVLPEPGAQAKDPEAGDQVCVLVNDASALGTLRLPCAHGVRYVNSKAVVVRGEDCVQVTYVPAVRADPVADVLCPSSPRSARGARLDLPGERDDTPSVEGSDQVSR
ncbi:MAG: hypothetical protein NTV23_00695 [Propionibacteriales bacterium]|nr:hypothetical protein [Propionibacteriales bacterium]